MISLAYAEEAATTQQAAPSPFVSLMPLIVIFGIFYFLIIRPQQKKMKLQKKMIAELKKGDMVITNSGFYGVIVGIGESTMEIKIADNTKVKILRSAISENLNSQASTGQAAPKVLVEK